MKERYLYRAWHKERKAMYDVRTILWDGGKPQRVEVFAVGPNDLFELFWIEEVELMQCTGERDKYGKLIFDGDILQPDEWDIAPVKWALNGWFLNNSDNYEPINDIPDALIIGNIHDNPALLNAQEGA